METSFETDRVLKKRRKYLCPQVRTRNHFLFFNKKFLLDRGRFCGATGTSCLGIPMSFKFRADQSSPALSCHLHAMIPRVISGCWAGHQTRIAHPKGEHDTIVPARPILTRNLTNTLKATYRNFYPQGFFTLSGLRRQKRQRKKKLRFINLHGIIQR